MRYMRRTVAQKQFPRTSHSHDASICISISIGARKIKCEGRTQAHATFSFFFYLCLCLCSYIVRVNRTSTSTREMKVFLVSGQTPLCIQSHSDFYPKCNGNTAPAYVPLLTACVVRVKQLVICCYGNSGATKRTLSVVLTITNNNHNILSGIKLFLF